MQMECQCGKKCDSLLMVRVWFTGQDDATDELVCPECAAEYASLKSSNPFDEEEVAGSPWCEECHSYHPTPANKGHWLALQCRKPWKGVLGDRPREETEETRTNPLTSAS